MRVLMISPFSKPDLGGVESHIDKLTRYLCEIKKVNVTLVTYMPLNSTCTPAKYERNGRLEVIRMRWFGKGWFRKLEPYFPLNMFYLCPGLLYKAAVTYIPRQNEFDVIHAHGFIAGAVAKVLVWLKRKRCVISTHAIYGLAPGSIRSKLFRWLLADFDVVLAVGEPSKCELKDIGIPAERLRIHPNWIQLEQVEVLSKEAARKSLGIHPTEFIVLFVGRMIGIKGELVLLDAAKMCKEDITFLFVGSGPESEKIAIESEHNNRVIYLGKVPDGLMNQVYCAADLFVSPVLYDEGFATVYLEALSCGTPVVTARRGCLPYFLSSSVADLLNEVNANVLLGVLLKHYRDRSLLVNRRTECRLYAEKNFSENNAKVIFDSYT